MALSSAQQIKSYSNAGAGRLGLAVFVITLFVSAFLLFSIQPFFAKMVLPRLGGSPAVWSVAMVFFQSMLLAGYFYAHLLSHYLKPRTAAIIHLTVMAAALLFMPIAIPAGWETPPETGQPIWLLGLFAASVGLPFFAVAANGPLLQAWFSQSDHPQADDPYFLYSASNLGSFASLFLFVAAIEPNLTISEISKSWMFGFVALAALIVVCSIVTGQAVIGGLSKRAGQIQSASNQAATSSNWIDIFKWIALSFVPSGLLVAVTAHISTDIAAAPFLWIVPLALFLLTFILAFARNRLFSVEFLSIATSILAITILGAMLLHFMIPVAAKLALHLVFFVTAALLCHSVLVDQRPSSERLTSFYLWMSFGGVLGGIFTTLLAPVLFSRIVEYPILIVLALICRPANWRDNPKNVVLALFVALLLALVFSNQYFSENFLQHNLAGGGIAFGLLGLFAIIYLFRSQTFFLVLFVVMVGLMLGMISAKPILSIDRSFFGVLSVTESNDKKHVLMTHGSTLHGAMAKTPAGQKPIPLTYYYRTGGIAATLFAAQQKWALAPLNREANVGIVGLGTGSMLCHRKPNEFWTSYEIDKAVVDAASDPKLFRFVSDCSENNPIIIGDARLKLADETNGKFDYLLIDAFSSDAIPVHLLTDEAFQLYFSKLADQGILTVHISNRYLELASIIQAIAAKNGYVGRLGRFKATPEEAAMRVTSSVVVVLARDNESLGTLATSVKWQPLPDLGTKPWTDDYSDMIGALMRGKAE